MGVVDMGDDDGGFCVRVLEGSGSRCGDEDGGGG